VTPGFLKPHPTGAAETASLIALSAVLAVGAATGVAWTAGWMHVLDSVRTARPAWLAVCYAGQVLAYGGYALAYRDVARAGGGPDFGHRSAAQLVTAGFGAFFPRGGFALDYAYLRAAGERPGDARTRVLGLGVLEYAVLAPAALVAAIVLLAEGTDARSSIVIPWLVGVPVGAVLALWAAHHRTRLDAAGGVWSTLASWLAGLEHLRRMARHPLTYWGAFVGMAVYWFGDILSLWAALRVFGLDLRIAAAILAFATGYAMTRRTLPLAGAGVTQVLLAYAVLWAGGPLAPAVPGVFTYGVFNIWLPTLIALLPWTLGEAAVVRQHAGDRGKGRRLRRDAG